MIWLDKTPRDPVDVLVEGQHKFLAMPMQREGAVGVQILTRTP
jgi:flagellar motor switch protein FliM